MSLLQSILSWWTRASHPRADHVEFVLYTRQGCPLCDDADQLLRSEQRRWAFALRRVDVDQDRELVRLHGECVPVVTVNGKVHFRGHVNRVLLLRLLRALARSVN